jgi:hypothetical protein
MTVLKRGMFACAFAAGSIGLAHCSGGSSGGPGPVGDPPATATPIVTATPTTPGSSSAPTATPAPGTSPTPKPKRSPQPTPTPTAGPTGTAAPTGTPTPAPVPSATPACTAQGDPSVGTAQLTGNQQIILVPCIADFRANITLPPNNGGGSTPIDLVLKASTDMTLGAPAPSAGTGTAIYYESFNPDFDLVLHGTVLAANISSQTEIVPGKTYAANLFLEGGTVAPTITGIVPQGHNIFLTFTLPQQNFMFPAGTSAQIVLYRST